MESWTSLNQFQFSKPMHHSENHKLPDLRNCERDRDQQSVDVALAAIREAAASQTNLFEPVIKPSVAERHWAKSWVN